MNKSKLKKSVLVLIAITALGTIGIKVSEQDVAPFVDLIVTEQQPVNELPTAPQTGKTAQTSPTNITANYISPQRKVHILHGDHTGGGHIYGAGKPCKSEFPQSWDEDKIIKEINLVAANDNLKWEQQSNGYHVTESYVDDVKVRVVKGRENKQVITAYPLNTGRNPCPANDR